MTDREMVNQLLSKIADRQQIYVNEKKYVELENAYGRESISFQFDDQGNLISIES